MQTTSIESTRDEAAERTRFESFKLGMSLPSSMPQRHKHSRSHSRNASISSSVSSLPSFMSTSKSTSSIDASAGSNPQPSSKRNSHHRRRSSVSTRIESAEMMGVPVPDFPSSTSDDNINLGEKDSIRRRALWALEGKPDVSFSKVEIPELSTPVMEKMMFDLATKPSLAQSNVPSFGPNLNTLMANKRDSFKLLPASSSSKDQLHTLVEEEEEEEEEDSHTPPENMPCPGPRTSDLAIPQMASPRPRRANLHLRPLSLTPDNLVNAVSALPSPSPTPSPRLGLKSLALAPSSSPEEFPNVVMKRSILFSGSRRQSSSLSDSPSPNVPDFEDGNVKRRSSISYLKSSRTSSPSCNDATTNTSGLPTPEMTPTTLDRRFSFSESLRRTSGSSSGDEEVFPNHPTQTRPLSASEQHFLFKSHNALLARITDLERALSVRRMSSGGYSNSGSSRPMSLASDLSSSNDYANGEPSDEMLNLVADLKAERDELKRDVDGWRTRVADMEKQIGIVAGRVESERRDAWVARSMAGLLEVEKRTLEKKLEQTDKTIEGLEQEKAALLKENHEVQQKVTMLEEDLERLKHELVAAKELARAAAVPDPLTTPVPKPGPLGFVGKKGLGFTSMDSETSSTDVEDEVDINGFKSRLPLRTVSEHDEDEVHFEEDNGLEGYEDENDSDAYFQSSSSFDSSDDSPRSTSHLEHVSSSVPPPPSHVPRSASPLVNTPHPTHVSRASLSRNWTFPVGVPAAAGESLGAIEVDRFFACLHEEGSDGGNSPLDYSYEKSKGLFASGFKYESEMDGPFFFDHEELAETMNVVPEEQESDLVAPGDDDEDMFGEVGGIQITFTPPQDEDDHLFDIEQSTSPEQTPVSSIGIFEPDLEEETTSSFNFGRPLPTQSVQETVQQIVPPSKSPVATPPVSRVSSPPSPSSIPRLTFTKSSFSFPAMPTSTPPRPPAFGVISAPMNTFVTPPNKRGGTMPSMIPQPVSSPSPIRSVAVSGKPKIGSTFIRQPERQPLIPTNNNLKSQNNVSSGAHGSTSPTQIPARLTPVINTRSPRYPEDATSIRPPYSEIDYVNLGDHVEPPTQSYPDSTSEHVPDFSCTPPLAVPTGSTSSSFASLMSAPLPGRLSFQRFTNFIPLSWTQRNDTLTAPPPVGDMRGVTPKQVIGEPARRVFISKEMQLEKLRVRLEREGRMKMKASIHVCCKQCKDNTVIL